MNSLTAAYSCAGDTAFNEAFASFVERRGVMEWLRAEHDQARIDAMRARWNKSDRFVAYLLEWRDELQRLYDQPINTFARRLLKDELLGAVERCYRANAEQFGDQDWYFESGKLSNARFVPLAAYNEMRDSFEALFVEAGESWPQFYEKVAELGQLESRSACEGTEGPRAASSRRTRDRFRRSVMRCTRFLKIKSAVTVYARSEPKEQWR